MKKNHVIIIVIGLLVSFQFTSCEKDDVKISSETKATNYWIYENMSLYYFWNHNMPNLDYRVQPDPEAYFYRLLYDEEDKWSYITDDYASLSAEFSGVPVTMGYNPTFYLVGAKNVMIVVNYVYPGSPAETAGLKRGDIILSINNTLLDTNNYYDLYSGNSYTVQLGVLNGNTVNPSGESLSMTAEVVNTDPSIFDSIIRIEGHKIGYLVFVEFISGDNNEFLNHLNQIFYRFDTANISNLIVDLRYNPGGEISTAAYLASLIGPPVNVTNENILVNLVYNTDLQDFFESEDMDEYLHFNFNSSVSGSDIDKVYFLTTSHSASASELIIIGLDPYMDVVKIGEATYGKYTGSWVIPDDNEEWAMMPIVTKYSNIDGYTNFKDGLTPDYAIKDKVTDGIPFGNTDDPMISKAVELITGIIPAKKALKSTPGFDFEKIRPLQDEYKSNVIISPPAVIR